MDINWEAEIASLLTDLSAVQREVLDLLNEKRARLAAVDLPGIAALQDREQQALAKLQACQDQRAKLLADAQAHGLPGDSIRKLANALPYAQSTVLSRDIQSASSRSRLLQHHALTNWLLT